MYKSILGTSPWKRCWETLPRQWVPLLKANAFFSSGSSSSSFFILSSYYQKKECPYSILEEVLLSSAFRSVQQPGSLWQRGSSRQNRLLPANNYVHTQVKFWLYDYLLCNCNCKHNIRLEGRKSLFMCQINRTFSSKASSMFKKQKLDCKSHDGSLWKQFQKTVLMLYLQTH